MEDKEHNVLAFDQELTYFMKTFYLESFLQFQLIPFHGIFNKQKMIILILINFPILIFIFYFQ